MFEKIKKANEKWAKKTYSTKKKVGIKHPWYSPIKTNLSIILKGVKENGQKMDSGDAYEEGGTS